MALTRIYASVVDISPSEQLDGDDGSIRALTVVISLSKPSSLDEVGENCLEPTQQSKLRKWSRASAIYKDRFVAHATFLVRSEQLLFATEIAEQRAIRADGLEVFETICGSLPAPSSHNKKGRARITLGDYRVDGVKIDPFEVLTDDLAVIGWLTRAFCGLYTTLANGVSEPLQLQVLIDRLPNDSNFRRAEILRHTLLRAPGVDIEVVGVPAVPDQLERDLLVDNLAGLSRELADGSWQGVAVDNDLFALRNYRFV